MRLLSDRSGGIRDEKAKRATTTAPEGKRGMALLMVITAIAVLTAVAVDFSYNTRVDMTLAANARDELRAYYLAQSSLNLSRLLLNFQFQFDRQSGQIAQMAQSALGGQGGAQAGGVQGALQGALAGAMAGPGGPAQLLGAMKNIRLWDVLPIDSGAINTFVGAAAGPPKMGAPMTTSTGAPGEAMPAEGLREFGSYDGSFKAQITDEETKINLNRLNNPGRGGSVTALQLMTMWQDPKWDFLFNEENSLRERYTREDMLAHLRDYIDEDETGTTLNLNSPSDVFVAGFGDERGPYTGYQPEYGPKNALFDSKSEIYAVAGMSDKMMAAFGEHFTVYPDINSRLNINSNDPQQQVLNIMLAAQDPTAPALRNPATIQLVLEQIQKVKALGPFIGMSVADFAGILESAGITVRPEIKFNAAQNEFLGDKSQTFTIKAVGQVGDVQKTITAVVRYNEGLGKLLYYRED